MDLPTTLPWPRLATASPHFCRGTCYKLHSPTPLYPIHTTPYVAGIVCDEFDGIEAEKDKGITAKYNELDEWDSKEVYEELYQKTWEEITKTRGRSM